MNEGREVGREAGRGERHVSEWERPKGIERKWWRRRGTLVTDPNPDASS